MRRLMLVLVLALGGGACVTASESAKPATSTPGPTSASSQPTTSAPTTKSDPTADCPTTCASTRDVCLNAAGAGSNAASAGPQQVSQDEWAKRFAQQKACTETFQGCVGSCSK